MKSVKGSATVEMAYIMPVVLFTFVVLIYVLFYLHDKNIINGALYETVVVGCQKQRWEEEDIEGQMSKLFQERISGKLIFFPGADVEIKLGKEVITATACSEKRKMVIHAVQKGKIVRPEKFIRDLRRIHGDGI